jgi:hypothetical protein
MSGIMARSKHVSKPKQGAAIKKEQERMFDDALRKLLATPPMPRKTSATKKPG